MNKFCEVKITGDSAFFDYDKPLLKDESVTLSCEWCKKPTVEFRGQVENLEDYMTGINGRRSTHNSLDEVEWEEVDGGWSAKEPFEFWFLFEGRLINFSHAYRNDNYDGYILSMTSMCRPVQTTIYGWKKEKTEND